MTRRVSVIVDADAGPFSAELAKAAGEATAFRALLEGIDDRISINVDVDGRPLRSLADDAVAARRAVDQTDRGINDLTGRLRVLGQAALVLGPALIPLGALAVPALSGIVTQLGFVAATGGTAILAFQGVGDAVTALNEALADPTADNIAKAREELTKLGPEARGFVTRIGEMRDEWIATRDAAAEGLFPGLTESLDNVDRMLPRAQDMFRELGDVAGDLIADGTESLTTERWAPFFDYLENQARPTMTDLADTVGSFTHGLAEMVMALDEGSQGFGGWLADQAADFDDWASGLADSEGLESFMGYIDDTGPQVAATMGAIAGAVADIVQAASPLGGPVLEGLELVADVTGALASTDAGSKIITMAAAYVALSKALSLVSRVAGAAGFAGVAGAAGGGLLGRNAARDIDRTAASTSTLAGRLQDARTNARQLGADARTMGTSLMTAGTRSEREMARYNDAAARTRATLASYGRSAGLAAAGVAAFTVASGAAGDSIGLQNTAMLGLMGSMMGPWGAAIGAGVGAFLDFKGATDDAQRSIDSLDAAMEGMDFRALNDGLDAADNSMAGLSATADTLDMGDRGKGITAAWLFGPIGAGVSGALDSFSTVFGQVNDQVEAAADPAERAAAAYRQLAVELGAPRDDAVKLDEAMARLAPTLEDMGYNLADFSDMSYPDVQRLAGEVEAYIAHADSAAGRTEALGDAMNILSDGTFSAADSASQLSAALDGVFGPTFAAEAATDAWRASLQDLSNLNVGFGFTEMTAEGRENNAMLYQAVQNTQDLITARVEAGAGEREVAGLMQESRREMIRHAVAAGVDADVIRRRVNELGLTPKLIRTVFREAGIGPIEQKARSLKASYKEMPKEVRTMVRAGNLPATQAGMRRLARQYDLTPKQVRTLVSIRNLASKDLDKVLRGLGAVDRKKATPKVDVDASQAIKGVNNTRARLDEIGGRRPTPKIGADNSEANKKAGQTKGDLDRVGRMRPTPRVGINDAASGPLSGIRALLGSLQSKTITVTTVHRTVRKNAMGGYWPAATMAAGLGADLPNRHQPMMAGAGPTRIWGEPEAGGESYIPHAPDRRGAAMSVLEQTAALFGATVVRDSLNRVDRYAMGAFRPGQIMHRPAARGGAGHAAAAPSLVGMEISGAVTVDGMEGRMRGVVTKVLEKRDRFDRIRAEVDA